MDFHSLTRRDLQSLCKKNKIPANKTNLAMADALTALEIVEGLDEFMNQSDANVLQSPITAAKLPATRTTRRKTAVKAESQLSSSQLVNRSCRLTSKKSLDGDMDQESVAQETKTNNVAKTPAARSTRKAPGAASCSSKVQESKKGVLVQPLYSTRRSTRLLEKCMADLSLKNKETLEKPDEIEESEVKVSAQEKNPAGSVEGVVNGEVTPGRDLNASMETEWEMLKHDKDQVTGDLGDIAVSEANTETNKEDNEVMSDEKESENSLVQEEEETLQADKAIFEEGSKQNDKDPKIGDTEIYVDFGDIPALEHANTETIYDNGESKSVQAFDSLVQVEHQEIEEAIHENVSETEKTNTFDEEAVLDRTDGVSEAEPEEDIYGVDSHGTISEADSNQETEHAIQENSSETEKINTFDEETMVDETDGVSEAEEDNSGVDSDGTFSEVGSNQETEQAYQENDSTFDENIMVDQTQTDGDSINKPEEDTEIYDDRGDKSVLEHANSEIINDNKDSKNAEAFDGLVQVEHQDTEEEIQKNDSEPEKANTFHEEEVVDRTDGDSRPEAEGDDSGVHSDITISEADSNQADNNQETEHAIQENDPETEKINTFDEDMMVDQTDGDSEAEKDNSGVDSDGTISEADSNQTDNQETEHANDPETEKINTFVEDTMVDQTDDGLKEDHTGVHSDVTIYEADIADAEMILPESEVSVTAPTSPHVLLEEAIVNTAPLSPVVAESISAQFPRPEKSASKNSAMKVVNAGTTNKENNMEMMMMMMNVNNDDNGESKGETRKKNKKKVEVDEEYLKGVSMRKLVKMVKDLSIKSSNNRAALQILPGNN